MWTAQFALISSLFIFIQKAEFCWDEWTGVWLRALGCLLAKYCFFFVVVVVVKSAFPILVWWVRSNLKSKDIHMRLKLFEKGWKLHKNYIRICLYLPIRIRHSQKKYREKGKKFINNIWLRQLHLENLVIGIHRLKQMLNVWRTHEDPYRFHIITLQSLRRFPAQDVLAQEVSWERDATK